MSSRMDLMDLARHLRQESLFVSSEKQTLQVLNEKVMKSAENLYHLSWIAHQQRQTLSDLLLSHTDSNLASFYHRSNALESVKFIDSYKQLGIHDSLYAEFLQQLRNHPKLLATCLNHLEKVNMGHMHRIANTAFSAIYGNCFFPEDEIHGLILLQELMSLQLASSDNPRRLLRHGSCAFSRIYKMFSEGLFSAKIFLTAALHGPVMHLLMADDLFLDIDPDKAAVRFHPQERLRHFGKEGTPEYVASLQRYRNWTISKLVGITNRFIEEIRNNLYCFPQSLSWLARQLYHILLKAGRVEVREVGAMCADLVFAFFICPAIVDPESYGITDIPISYIARFNLMQVAQILQVLAMSKWEDIDTKLMDLYGKFEKNCMSSLLDFILEGSQSESPSDVVHQFQDIQRSGILITESELYSLVSFVRSVETETSDSDLKKTLCTMINHLPAVPSNATSSIPNGNASNCASASSCNENGSSTKRSFLNKVSRKRMPSSLMEQHHMEENNGHIDGESVAPPLEDVLVVPILNADFECPGMMNEEKVLSMESQKKKQSFGNGILPDESGTMAGGSEVTEKRTRFSLSNDQESIGTSENLEAVSEAASNHSVASSISLENENENDNLSDMVSANVSGRGTPNVSGRDTPSSQIEGEGNERRPLDLMSPGRKQNQDDIEDKFGKFEIQPMIEGDETKSMVSDTWSTDVLASDSETIEQSEVSSQVSQGCLDRALLDTSETASQSDAWSTDVLASDTARLQDVDTDDTASITRSDDAARSEVDGELAGMERRNVLDCDMLRDPFLSDTFGIADNPRFANAPLQRASYDAPAFGDRVLRDKMQRFESDSDCFKVPDISSMDMENVCNVSSLEADQLIHEESSMQSLGHVSLAVRELPDAGDHDSGITLLDSLQETVSQQTSREHRSSIVDILSMDLTRTLNLPASGDNSMEFDRDMLSPGRSHSSSTNSNDSNFTPSKLPVFERGAKRKLHEFGGDEDTPQPRVVSMPCGAADGNARAGCSTAEHGEGSSARHVKAISVPGLGSGAIPKLSSFRKNVGDDMEMDDKFGGDKHRKGLFKISGFRLTFKKQNRKPQSPFRDADNDGFPEGGNRPSQNFAEMRAMQLEAGDEILAKYRKKSPVVTTSNSAMKSSTSEISDSTSGTSDSAFLDNNSHALDLSNVESSTGFSDVKCKLRLVLGSADLQTLPWLGQSRSRSSSNPHHRLQENELVAFLKVLLAEAINLQQRPLMAHLHEALRCVRLFDDIGCQKLLKSLRNDYRRRAPYITYLVKCRQGLLSTHSHLRTLTGRVLRAKEVCNQYLVMISVKMFLEKHDKFLQSFGRAFQELVVADEKAIKVEEFLTCLFNYMKTDPMWQMASESQVEHAQAVIEHSVMSRIYMFALHPNGDGDVLRDKVLHEHMQKLSQAITPDHKDLKIPKMYHSECPWPSAQAELVNINAYKTPRDKIQCVLRCCSTIMNLLSMAGDKSVPAADDLMPVLVYVLVKANPPHLLSTVQYVNTFYEKQLEGEEAYWWAQFASGVEFIKNMDY